MQKKKPKNYAKNKKAFDSVFSYYRNLSMTSSISAANMSASGKSTVNPAKPKPIDFMIDVDKLVKIIVPESRLIRFYITYTTPWVETDLEQEMLADRMLGGQRHSFEQRLGEIFIKRGIHPVQARGYFWCMRRSRDNKAGR